MDTVYICVVRYITPRMPKLHRMKFFLIILLLISLRPISTYCQRNQSDSFYKANNVKSKIENTNGSYIDKIVTNYNRIGKEIEILEFDTANNIQTKIVFEYDKNSNCIKTVSYPYYYEDRITHNKLEIPFIDSGYIFITKFEYDKNNRLKSKTERKFNGELFSKELYSYNPKIKIEQFFDSNKVESESKIYFSDKGFMVRQFRERSNKTEKWNFIYTNKFNLVGQIIETKYDIKYTAINKKYYRKINYPIKETCEYFKNGLLEKYTYFYESKTTWIHNFTYEYW